MEGGSGICALRLCWCCGWVARAISRICAGYRLPSRRYDATWRRLLLVVLLHLARFGRHEHFVTRRCHAVSVRIYYAIIIIVRCTAAGGATVSRRIAPLASLSLAPGIVGDRFNRALRLLLLAPGATGGRCVVRRCHVAVYGLNSYVCVLVTWRVRDELLRFRRGSVSVCVVVWRGEKRSIKRKNLDASYPTVGSGENGRECVNRRICQAWCGREERSHGGSR
jgi:hypothetical protein